MVFIYSSRKNDLEVFSPGLFIIDRQTPEDCLLSEHHKVSLCWSQPQLLINLVDKGSKLTRLNLSGYEELTDLALEYIAGQTENCRGLQKLVEITLPKKCYISVDGLKILIENLRFLELIENQGKMGVLLQRRKLELKGGQEFFRLKEFCQMESVSSGGLEEDEDLLDQGKKRFRESKW